MHFWNATILENYLDIWKTDVYNYRYIRLGEPDLY